MELKKYQFWFCTGSQDLYGDECLAKVAQHSKQIVDKLNKSGMLPVSYTHLDVYKRQVLFWEKFHRQVYPGE